MSTRESALAAHHRALGSNLEDWNGMGAPWTYHSDPCDEHDAVRERAGLFDVSGLKKVRVRGSDAAAVCDHVITRDMSRIPSGVRPTGRSCRMTAASATTPSSSPWPMTTSSSSTVQAPA